MDKSVLLQNFIFCFQFGHLSKGLILEAYYQDDQTKSEILT